MLFFKPKKPMAAELPARMAAISTNLVPSLFCPLTTAEKKRKMRKRPL